MPGIRGGEDEAADRPEQRRDQGERRDHRDDHGHCCARAHLGDQRDTHDGQRHHRDDHRQAREDHRGSGGADRATGGVGPTTATFHLAAIARHDEQRVVDRHGDTEHRDDARRGLVHRHELGAQGHQHHRQRDTDDAGDQRDEGRDQRTERDDHHHERDRETDQLGLAALFHDLDERTGGLDL